MHIRAFENRLELFDAMPQDAVRLRNALLGLQTLAVELVEFTHNDTETHDEKLAHRLGLVPIQYLDGRAVHNVFLNRKECNAICSRCAVQFVLDVSEPGIVYSHQLMSSNPHVRALPGFPLCELPAGGRLKLRAVAVRGDALAHIKHSPTSPPAFFYTKFRVALNPTRDLTFEQSADLIRECPKDVFTFEGTRVVVKPTHECIGCFDCVRLGLDFRNDKDDEALVQVTPDISHYVFPIELVGQLCFDEIVHAVIN